MLVGAQAQASDSSVGSEQDPDIELLEYLGGLVQEQRTVGRAGRHEGLPNGREGPMVRDDDVR